MLGRCRVQSAACRPALGARGRRRRGRSRSVMTTAAFTRARAWSGWLWGTWLLILGVWTFALVTPYPVQVEHEVLPAEAGYPTSKLLHVGMYAFLTAVTAFLPARGVRRWLPVLVLSLHGFGTEYCQTFVPLRTGCWA